MRSYGKYLCLILAAAAMFSLCSCQLMGDGEVKENDTFTPPPNGRYLDFRDVRIPNGMYLDRDGSFVYESDTVKAGMLNIYGRNSMMDTLQFFETNMPRDGWKMLSTFKYQKSILLFTFFRKHDAGFLQQVQTAPGTRLRFTAWAHAWSNHNVVGHTECTDNGRCSCGVGEGSAFILEGQAPPLTGDSWNDAIPNFTFYVGIDPTGGVDPYADTVVWGRGAHIYNAHAQPPAVEVTAQANTVTVFLRSKTMWAFKHNDAYWDDAQLITVDGDEELPEALLRHHPDSPPVGKPVTIEARSKTALTRVQVQVQQPSGALLAPGRVRVGSEGEWHTWTWATSPLKEEGLHSVTLTAAAGVRATDSFQAIQETPDQRGAARVQYPRTYVLLPPDATAAWAVAVVEASWDDRRYTIGGSADDSGIGDLDTRQVIAVNPERWPADLGKFFKEHYPGVKYVPIEASTPEKLKQKLKSM